MDEKLQAFRSRATAARKGRGGRGYPGGLRREAVGLARELRAEGWSQSKVQKALGITWSVLAGWGAQSAPAPPELEVLRPVTVVSAQPERSYVLRIPTGWAVEGLSLGDVVRLVDELR